MPLVKVFLPTAGALLNAQVRGSMSKEYFGKKTYISSHGALTRQTIRLTRNPARREAPAHAGH